MKIALDFISEKIKNEISADLIQRGLEIDFSSIGSLWIRNVKTISFSDKNELNITINKGLKTYTLFLNEIEYFEIHND